VAKRTLQGTRQKRIKTSGFRARTQTASGRQILKSRRRKRRSCIALA